MSIMWRAGSLALAAAIAGAAMTACSRTENGDVVVKRPSHVNVTTTQDTLHLPSFGTHQDTVNAPVVTTQKETVIVNKPVVKREKKVVTVPDVKRP